MNKELITVYVPVSLNDTWDYTILYSVNLIPYYFKQQKAILLSKEEWDAIVKLKELLAECKNNHVTSHRVNGEIEYALNNTNFIP